MQNNRVSFSCTLKSHILPNAKTPHFTRHTPLQPLMKKLSFRIKLPQELRDRALRAQNPIKLTTPKDINADKNASATSQIIRQYSDTEVYDRINSLLNEGASKSSSATKTPPVTVSGDSAPMKTAEDIIKGETSSEVEKIDALAKFLSRDPNAMYLPQRFVTRDDMKTPYEEAAEINKTGEKQRLSVSTIIPYAYCELSRMYQLYMGDKRVTNATMARGTEIHRKLEVTTHPQMNVQLDMSYGEKIIEVDESESSKKFIKDLTLKSLLEKQKRLVEQKIAERMAIEEKMTEFETIKAKYGVEDIEEIEHILPEDVTAVAKTDVVMVTTDDQVSANTMEENLADTESVVEISESEIPTESLQTKADIAEADGVVEDSIITRSPEDHPPSTIAIAQSEEDVSIDETVTLEESLQDQLKQVLEAEKVLKLTTDVDISTTQAFKLTQSLNRTLSLLMNGECREVLVHGFYNKDELSLVNLSPSILDTGKDIDIDRNIVISGIIDDLRISSNYDDAVETFKKDVLDDLKDCFHLDVVIDKISKQLNKWTDENPAKSMLYIIVNDDKTTMSGSKPPVQTQKTHLSQVGIYRLLLQRLIRDPQLAYLSYRANMRGRRTDVDAPLAADIVTFCAIQSNYLLQDFISLKDGEPFSFMGPDATARKGNEPYYFQNQSNQSSIDVLNGEWARPPTISHIIARLVQVQSLLKPLMSDTLQVTYISQRSEMEIGKAELQYDEDHVKKIIDRGLELWLGKREPASTSSDRYCKYCTFKDKCPVPQKKLGLL